MVFFIYDNENMDLDEQMTTRFLNRLEAAIEADDRINVSNLALKAGLGNSVIRLMLKNRSSPRMDTAEKICRALDTNLVTFLSNAQSEEEREIVHLLSQLDVASRRELLGYGRGLRADRDQTTEEAPANHSINSGS